MKQRTRPPEQDDLLRPRLVDMIDLRHELVKLTTLIDFEVFEREWAGFFASATGRSATPPRLVAGPLYFQPAYLLSDEAIIARCVDRTFQTNRADLRRSEFQLTSPCRCGVPGPAGTDYRKDDVDHRNGPVVTACLSVG